ncbi:type IV secretion system protein VirB3 [Legionella quinlivanii]|uniref:Type IV secretion system protein VirB3 n=1 Tax=Legionella quinlivanii TaxID=45073 RepID=A0A0W0XSW1_9GAMM|nr:VirB3 family type IV secretion system protein [Legionella quinlivanii]KTD47895.1 type IV secretion system protein VirB3 [Legionella quinlivanii]SEG37169.1 type IV secretion system protein VirB3 [Legionella quinlivanii DSM 21216]STY10111.1 type IV secretion system protein VirB3 [Legionella quinlivanii]
MPDNHLHSNPIFGALTRPAMTGGVTLEFHVMNLIVSMAAFIGLGSMLYGLIFLPIHACGWLACKHDTALLTILSKRLFKLPNLPNSSFWGVRAYEPF